MKHTLLPARLERWGEETAAYRGREGERIEAHGPVDKQANRPCQVSYADGHTSHGLVDISRWEYTYGSCTLWLPCIPVTDDGNWIDCEGEYWITREGTALLKREGGAEGEFIWIVDDGNVPSAVSLLNHKVEDHLIPVKVQRLANPETVEEDGKIVGDRPVYRWRLEKA